MDFPAIEEAAGASGRRPANPIRWRLAPFKKQAPADEIDGRHYVGGMSRL